MTSHVPIRAASPVLVAGPTNSGKTRWVQRLLSLPGTFSRPVTSILYCYGIYQKNFKNYKNYVAPIRFREGLPTREELEALNEEGGFHVLVLDDLMERIIKTPEMQELFTTYCHHLNISAIFITQNVFAQGRYARTISLNCHIIVLFANRRDESQVRILARQFFPTRWKRFLQVYEQVTSSPYAYLLIDCTPSHPRALQVRSSVFPGDSMIVYEV